MWSMDTIKWIDVELTSFCNIECPGCLRQTRKDKVGPILNKKMISFSNLKEWLPRDKLPNLKLVNFCGSVDEPTTHPEMLKIVDHFSEFSEINIASNGSTKTESFWSQLGERPTVSVFFGIDGIDQKTLHKYRVGSSYKKIQQNYRAFIKAGGFAQWQFIVFDHNEHQLEEAKRISKEEGFKNFRTIYSHRSLSGEVKVEQESNNTISCRYSNMKRIFINHLGYVLPCCYLNSEQLHMAAGQKASSNYGTLFNSLGKGLSNNLNYGLNLEEIVDGELFESIVNSWTSDTPIDKCVKTCMHKQRDIFQDQNAPRKK